VVDVAVDQDKDRSAAAAIIVIPPGPIYDPRLFAKRANAPFQEADDLVDLQRQKRSRLTVIDCRLIIFHDFLYFP